MRRGRDHGRPIALLIPNKDWAELAKDDDVAPEAPPDASGANRAPVTRPRPGHADLAGALKYELEDIRDVLERASARETAARVAAAGLARQLLAAFGIEVRQPRRPHRRRGNPQGARRIRVAHPRHPGDSPLRCADPEVERR